MSTLTAKLVEIFSLGEIRAGILDVPRPAWPEPGQYLPAQLISTTPAILPTHLFKVATETERLALAPLPADWRRGDRLALLPPQGQGFQLPTGTRRVGLCAVDVSPNRLLPLVPLALAQDASVTLFCEPQPAPDILQRIPSVVEITPISALKENLEWPDFLAVDLPRCSLPRLVELLSEKTLPVEGQALVRTPLPCRGLGECGVCTVETRHGRKLACVDGPVFPLEEVFHVAG